VASKRGYSISGTFQCPSSTSPRRPPRSDGFIFVAPEYNYGPSAVLKNALDWVYPEWNRKAAAFVSYGSAMGARGVQQLRMTKSLMEGSLSLNFTPILGLIVTLS
jgi:hypothetical protein